MSSQIEVLADSRIDRGYQSAGTPGTVTFNNTVTFDSVATRTLTVDIVTTFSGVVSGTAGFTKAGASTLTLSNTGNTISGAVSATAGTLAFGASTALSYASLSPGAGGTLSWSAGAIVGALTGSGAFTLSTALTVGSANSPATATYSGVLSGTALLTKDGSGLTQTFDGDNTHTGGITISAGTLVARNGGPSSGSLGGLSGTITVASGATLEFNGNGADQTFTKTSAALAVSGGRLFNSGNNNTLQISSGTLSTSALQLEAAASTTFTLSTTGIISGATIGVTKLGAGTVVLDAPSSTFGGKVTVSAGTLDVTKFDVQNSPSSIGDGSNTPSIDVAPSATLRHVGTTDDSTNRVLNFTSTGTHTISSNGTGGSITFTAAPTFVTGAHTIALSGANTSALNRLSGNIINSGTSPNLTTVSKSGNGYWALTGTTLSFTGGLNVSAGELYLGGVARTLSTAIAISGGTLSNSTLAVTATAGVTMTGGTLTAPLSGVTPLTFSSGTSTVTPGTTTGSNATTGATTVATGAIVRAVTANAVVVTTAGNGRVLGNGTVTVNGTIRTGTSSSSNQKGQLRYNNITLNSGARLEIGAA